MRTYTFKLPCGHTTRSVSKAKAFARPCNDCLVIGLGASIKAPIPRGFGLWSKKMQEIWVRQHIPMANL